MQNIIGDSVKMQNLRKMIYSISHSTATVLINGETGTGKELVAQAIHATSPRAHSPLIEVNSAAIPENLFESEMFGYEDGAFTGAKKGGMPGKFEMADKGTLFLDEIDQIPYHIQPKLLRALQENIVDKLGGSSTPVDVRLIVATNKDLQKLVEEEKFREDLYYRLNVIVINIPPLREHREDIPMLALYFIKQFNQAFNKEIEGVSREAMERLCQYHWPGNIRELRNAIERAMIIAEGSKLQAEDFDGISSTQRTGCEINTAGNRDGSFRTLEEVRAMAEKEAITQVLKHTDNKSEAARILGITRPALYYKIDKYRL